MVAPAEEAEYNPSDDVIVFEQGSLYELVDPILFGEEYPQNHRYTELGKFRENSVTDELFE